MSEGTAEEEREAQVSSRVETVGTAVWALE